MADKKITQLTNITGANLVDADEFVVVDISADETKAITLGELKEAFDSGSGFVRITGDTMTGDLSFGDNVKATFGASADLQVFHNSSNNHSYIIENGTGSLIAQAENFIVQNTSGINNILARSGAEVELYHNGFQKLETTISGINVTGTVEADGLTVDGDIRINTTSGKLTYVNDTAGWTVDMEDGTSDLYIRSGVASPTDRLKIDGSGDISFYEDTGTTAKFFWDASAESLGIGTTSPSKGIDIVAANTAQLRLRNTEADATLKNAYFQTGHYTNSEQDVLGVLMQSQSSANVLYLGGSSGGMNAMTDIRFYTATSNTTLAGTERMRIDSSGRVGIGTTSPTGALDVQDNTGSLSATRDITSEFHRNDGTYNPRLQFNHSTDGSQIKHTYSTTASNLSFTIGSRDKLLNISQDGDISFYEDTGTTPKFFWDASAERLGIGTTSPISPLTLYPSGTDPAFLTYNSGNSAEITSYAAHAGLQLMSYQSDGGSPYTKTSALIANADGTVPSEMQFWTKTNGQSSAAERMRIDSSGNLKMTGGGSVGWANWTITESGGSLYFATGGTNKMKLDASGNLDVVGSVNSNATIS